MPSTLLILLIDVMTPAASACSQPMFSTIPLPAIDAKKGHGVATGQYNWEGKQMVGARLSMNSAWPVDAWRPVLQQGDKQDDWMPAEFGYEEAAMLDRTHMYLRFDIGFLLGAVRVQRQLVVELAEQTVSAATGSAWRTCWKMVDPGPWEPKLTGLANSATWEKSSAGWWEVTPRAEGGALVSYQWWTEAGAMPVSILQYGMSTTLPNLLKAFETRVGAVGGG